MRSDFPANRPDKELNRTSFNGYMVSIPTTLQVIEIIRSAIQWIRHLFFALPVSETFPDFYPLPFDLVQASWAKTIGARIHKIRRLRKNQLQAVDRFSVIYNNSSMPMLKASCVACKDQAGHGSGGSASHLNAIFCRNIWRPHSTIFSNLA